MSRKASPVPELPVEKKGTETTRSEMIRRIHDMHQGYEEHFQKLGFDRDGCLAFENFRYCGRTPYDSGCYCYWHLDDPAKTTRERVEEYFGHGTTLKEALVNEVKQGRSLAGAIINNYDFSGSMLNDGPDLSNASFNHANLAGCKFSYSTLRNVDFRLANLERVFFSCADIRGSHFDESNLFMAKFRHNDFTDVVGLSSHCFLGYSAWGFPKYMMLEDYPIQCHSVYRSLTVWFVNHGMLSDASWAAYRSKLIAHKLLVKEFKHFKSGIDHYGDFLVPQSPQTAADQWTTRFVTRNRSSRSLIAYILRYERLRFRILVSNIMWITTGYGEKPLNPLICSGVILMGYSLVYHYFSALQNTSTQATVTNFWDSLYFSIVTFSTLGYGDISPIKNFRLIASSEALLGLLFTGLFIFTISRRAGGRS